MYAMRGSRGEEVGGRGTLERSFFFLIYLVKLLNKFDPPPLSGKHKYPSDPPPPPQEFFLDQRTCRL